MTTPSSQEPRVAIVTGGSGGFGRAVAERLASDGMPVVVHYSSNRGLAEEVVAGIAAAGGSAIAAGGDVADEADMASLFQVAEQQYGGVDVVVHTAGILKLSTLADLDLDDFDQIVRVNLRGTFVVDQQAVRKVRSGGAIVNFSTSVSRRAVPTYAGYAATKGAVDVITMILAKELKGRDVTVNTVAPGPVATPMFLGSRDQAAIDTLASMPALGRLGRPEDIAAIVAFLAGPARWINGQVLYADGGLI
ncbi:MAG: SDR family oxidoreductase [Acidimicrobiales bacterium]